MLKTRAPVATMRSSARPSLPHHRSANIGGPPLFQTTPRRRAQTDFCNVLMCDLRHASPSSVERPHLSITSHVPKLSTRPEPLHWCCWSLPGIPSRIVCCESHGQGLRQTSRGLVRRLSQEYSFTFLGSLRQEVEQSTAEAECSSSRFSCMLSRCACSGALPPHSDGPRMPLVSVSIHHVPHIHPQVVLVGSKPLRSSTCMACGLLCARRTQHTSEINPAVCILILNNRDTPVAMSATA